MKTLANGHQTAGFYKVQWNGKTENGIALPRGLYIYRIQAEYTANEKMLLLK